MYEFTKKGVTDMAASLSAEWAAVWDGIDSGGRDHVEIAIDGKAIQVPVCADNCNAIVYLLKDMIISEITGEATIGNTRTAYDEQELRFNALEQNHIASLPKETSLTPAEMALDEPDASDSAEVSALRDQLLRRLDINLAEYFDSFYEDRNIMVLGDMSSEIAATTGAYAYMTGIHNFHTSELEYLLQFEDPLKVVAVEFEWDAATDNRSDIMWKVFHEQEALKNGRHPLVSYGSDDDVPMPEPSGEDTMQQKLFDRLDANLSDYCESLMEIDKQEIIGMAEDIAARYAAREYMKTAYDFKTGEVAFLLQFQDPLSLVAESWPDTLDGLVDMSDVMADILADSDRHGHFAKVMDASNPASKESARTTTETEKPSVLARIREAAKLPKEPQKDKPARDRSGPEL